MQTLTIERLSHDLRGVAHADGTTWFVDGGLPGETVEASVLLRRQQLVDATVTTLLAASPARIQPACAYYRQCGGCSLQHLDQQVQVREKQRILLDQLARIGKVVPQRVAPPLLSAPWQYRRRVRLACKWSSAKRHLAIGLRERHSQAIVEIGHCAVLLPVLQALLLPVRQCLSRWSQPRQLGHIELLAADNGVGLLLRVLAQPSVEDIALLQALSASHNVSVFLQTAEKTPAEWLCGAEALLTIRHAASGATFDCVPGDFVQGNAAVNTLLVDAVLAAMQPDATDTVLEAFCGLGNFTLPLASAVAQVTALELSETMLARARRAQGGSAVQWQACNLDRLAPQAVHWPPVKKILLDPPRDGAQAFCRAVPLDQVERIVYVSCNPSTLARDAAILVDRGFALESVQLVDMFPQTAHIEALAVFLRDPARNCRVKKQGSKPPGGPALKRLKR